MATPSTDRSNHQRFTRALGFDCHDVSPVVSVRFPWDLANWTMPLLEVIIVGGGFAGLDAARRLRNVECEVTLVDRQNHHLFQMLLYQVATAGLSPGDIAEPIRSILRLR